MIGTAPDFLRFLKAIRQGGAPILTAANPALDGMIGALTVEVEVRDAVYRARGLMG